jgi:hypothetical protein
MEAHTDPASAKLKAQLEQIIDSDDTVLSKCLAIQRTLTDALPGLVNFAKSGMGVFF